MGFSRQEYWSGLPFPSPGDLPDPGIKPGSPALEADALTSEPPGKPTKGRKTIYNGKLFKINILRKVKSKTKETCLSCSKAGRGMLRLPPSLVLGGTSH